MKTFKERGFNDDLDLDTLITVFINRINYLLSIFIITFFLFFIIYLFQERVYQSSALLQFEKQTSPVPINGLDAFTLKDTELTAEREIFRSLNTIEGAKDKLNKIFKENSPTIYDIAKGINFYDDGKNLLTVNYSNNDSDSTTFVLQSLIDEFISDRIENNRITAIKGIEFVDTEIPKLRDQLSSAELDLIEFRSSGGNNLIFDNESRENSIESLNQEIKSIELKEIELKEFYKSSHPIYSTLIEQKNILYKELETLESDIQNLPSEQRQLFNLTQRVNIYSSSLEELERQKLSLSLSAASSTSNIRIINFPSDAIRIKPQLTLLLFSLIIPLVAYFVFLLNHFLTDKIMSLDSLMDYLEDRSLLLGAFPYINRNNSNQKILNEIEKNFTDRVIINILNTDKKIFLISSMKEGVGKSYFSEKIIKNLSNFSEKVCLLDLDLRKKGISQTSKVFREEGVDISDYLNDEPSSYKSVFLKSPKIDDPLAYLNSDDLENLMHNLKQNFDKIIIDSPPMGTFIDAKLISNFSDQVICVLSSHESSFSEISSINKELHENIDQDTEILFFLNKVRYFLEIFWFSVRYPIYGNYNYYNPYSYYSNDGLNSLGKLKKYVSFVWKYIQDYYLRIREILLNFLKK